MSPKDRVLILGADGYLGWSLHQYLQSRDRFVMGVDNGLRRKNVAAVGSDSLTPISSVFQRNLVQLDIAQEPGRLAKIIDTFKPTTVVHFAEQPSAPFSMRSLEDASETQRNNVIGTMNLVWILREYPDTHLVKLGTMGEYGDWIYNHIPIPESSRLRVTANDSPEFDIPTPRFAGSFYHWSKVFDSFNIEFATKIWSLKTTDLNQGVVYGVKPDKIEDWTRFDYDSYFGTVINRFAVQAVANLPLSIYGKGGQTRGFININDSMKAIELVIQNPPASGEYRIVNQITEVLKVTEIAQLVRGITDCQVEHIDNPRTEAEEHTYEPEFKLLKEFGLTEPRMFKKELPKLLLSVERFKARINPKVISPKTSWKEQECA